MPDRGEVVPQLPQLGRQSAAGLHRIGYLERLYEHIVKRPGVKLWTGEEILDWYENAAPHA